MSKPRIRLYYQNVTAGRIGGEHGITDERFEELAARTVPAIKAVNAQRKDGKTAYRDLPYDKETPRTVKRLADGLGGFCENLVVLGIGGSALGNIALQTALNPYMHNLDEGRRRGPRLFVFDNVDPAQFGSFLDWVSQRLDGTVFNVISKSGRTAETAAQLLAVRDMLISRLGEAEMRRRIVATTDAKSGTLRTIADADKLACLEVPDGVGGRFSVLSAVGLFSAAMCGIDVDSLLEGARDMDERVSGEDFFANPAAVNAAVNWHYYNAQKPISVMMPYSYALKDMADWYRQLWAESLGKARDLKGNEVHVGPTPVKALGATDQHSQVQLYREGPNDKLFTFLETADFGRDVAIGPAPGCAPELGYLGGRGMTELLASEKSATEYALVESSRPCLTVLFPKVEAHSVGQFIYMFEVTTSIAADLFGINAYDQPAVELGKEAAFALMGRDGYGELAEKIRLFAEPDEKFVV
jgi:glucose-6-phosphate isomerase